MAMRGVQRLARQSSGSEGGSEGGSVGRTGWTSGLSNSRSRRVLSTVAVMGLLMASLGAGTIFAQSAAATTPGTPGTTQPGTPIFAEDFENGTTNAALGAQSYSAPGSTAYVGSGGQTYTGSPDWINAARCNGVILSNANTTTPAWAISGSVASGTNNRCSENPGVKSYQFLRMLAQGMGQQFTPGSPTTNHVNSSYTECQSTDVTGGAVCDTIPSGPTNGVMFQTVTPIPVTPGHYYTFGVNTAYMNCGNASADPGYQFAWTDSVGAAHPIGTALNGCQTTPDPNVKSFTQSVTSNIGGVFGTVTKTVRIDSMTTNAAFQANTSSLGIKMWNVNGTTNGNDGAFDNLRLIDVTPQLDKSFTPALIAPGGTSTLTLTVTNTSELDAKHDWTVTDVLPAGMTIAASPNVGGTCMTNPAVGTPFQATAIAGSGTLAVLGGDTPDGQAACTVTVNVTALTEGTYTNGPANITTNLNPPASTTLVVRAPRLTLTKALGTARAGAGDQFTVAIRTGSAGGSVVNGTTSSTTTGTGSAVDPGTGTTGTYVATAGTPYFLTESGANLVAYNSTISCTDAAGLQPGLPNGTAFNGSFSVSPAAGAAISCTLTNRAIPLPNLNIAKTVGTVTGPDANGTYTVNYAITVRNSGGATGTYGALTDTPAFAANLTTTGGSWTGASAGTWNGTGSIVLRGAGTSIAAGATDTYNLSVTFRYADQSQATSCNGPGTGLYNSVALPAGQEQGTPADNAACTDPPRPPAPSLTIVKSATPTVVGAVGDTVAYSFVVTNTGNVTLHAVTVADTFTAPAGPALSVSCPTAVLAPGADVVCTSSVYVVTQADVDAGSIVNSATAAGTPPSGPAVVSPPSQAVVTAPSTPGLSLVKSALISKDVNGDGLAGLGDEVSYTFTVHNTGQVTLHAVAVADQLVAPAGPALSVSCPAGDLAPGADVVCTSSVYVVTQADVDAGSIVNSATAAGTPPSGPPVVSPPSTTSTPSPHTPGIRITKRAFLDDVNGDGLAGAGEVIVYQFEVENTGNVTLHDVQVSDPRLDRQGLDVTCPSEVLAPGLAMVCLSNKYVVTQEDIDAGVVSNVATASGVTPPGVPVKSRSSKADVPTRRLATAGLPTPGSLAFTGANVFAGAALGLALLVAGVGALRLSRRRGTRAGHVNNSTDHR